MTMLIMRKKFKGDKDYHNECGHECLEIRRRLLSELFPHTGVVFHHHQHQPSLPHHQQVKHKNNTSGLNKLSLFCLWNKIGSLLFWFQLNKLPDILLCWRSLQKGCLQVSFRNRPNEIFINRHDQWKQQCRNSM